MADCRPSGLMGAIREAWFSGLSNFVRLANSGWRLCDDATESHPDSLLDDSSIPGVEIPREFELLCQEVEAGFGVAPYSVLGGAFGVAGTAIGRHSFLDTGFFSTQINASLACAFCDDDVGRSEE